MLSDQTGVAGKEIRGGQGLTMQVKQTACICGKWMESMLCCKEFQRFVGRKSAL